LLESRRLSARFSLDGFAPSNQNHLNAAVSPWGVASEASRVRGLSQRFWKLRAARPPRSRAIFPHLSALWFLMLVPLSFCPSGRAEAQSATLGELLTQGAELARAQNWRESLAAYRPEAHISGENVR